MIYNFTGRGVTITEELKTYAEKRFEHIGRLIGGSKMEPLIKGDLEFRSGENIKYVVQATLDIGNKPLHVTSQGTTLHEAIDAAAKALGAEVQHDKGKRIGFARRQAALLKDFVRGLRR